MLVNVLLSQALLNFNVQISFLPAICVSDDQEFESEDKEVSVKGLVIKRRRFHTNRMHTSWSVRKWPECCAANDSGFAEARILEGFRRKCIATSGSLLQSPGVRTCYEIPLRIRRRQFKHSDNTFTILTSVNICGREQRSVPFHPVILATP
jgi:hypothetical protein